VTASLVVEGEATLTSRTRVRVLNVSIDAFGYDEALRRAKSAKLIVTPNMDHLWNLQRDAGFLEIYRRADLILCDSKVLSLLIRVLLGIRVQAIPGSEFFPALCRHVSGDERSSVFLLGGTTERHASLAASRLAEATGARVVGAYSPPFGFEHDAEAFDRISTFLREAKPTLVGVGVGSPKQEKLISQLLDVFPRGVTFCAIGATIDFESGLVPRAPAWMRKCCLEWLFRFINEPRRLFKRYFVSDVQVIFLLARRGWAYTGGSIESWSVAPAASPAAIKSSALRKPEHVHPAGREASPRKSGALELMVGQLSWRGRHRPLRGRVWTG
jgi:exopolysaccharide biosynthesis WecB/TagA/CpsF family protein